MCQVILYELWISKLSIFVYILFFSCNIINFLTIGLADFNGLSSTREKNMGRNIITRESSVTSSIYSCHFFVLSHQIWLIQKLRITIFKQSPNDKTFQQDLNCNVYKDELKIRSSWKFCFFLVIYFYENLSPTAISRRQPSAKAFSLQGYSNPSICYAKLEFNSQTRIVSHMSVSLKILLSHHCIIDLFLVELWNLWLAMCNKKMLFVCESKVKIIFSPIIRWVDMDLSKRIRFQW